MPHTTAHKHAVRVEHPNGIIWISRKAAEAKADGVHAYWRDPAKTVLVIAVYTPEERANDYEYGGKKSYSRHLTVEACDVRNHTIIRVPVEHRDRTGIPVREPGGAKVMQLKPLVDRRTSGQHIPNHDRLWRPQRKRKPQHSSL